MLFTTLIPVYKTQFIEDTVQCLKAQTLQNFQVIFSDDSPTQDLVELLGEFHADTPITFPFQVIQGKRLGPVSNCHHLLTAWNFSSPYIHYLLDDDLIFPDFYRWHAQAYERTQAKTCISARIVVNEKKSPLGTSSLPDYIWQADTTITPLSLQSCITSIIPTCNNWLGELSSATFHGATMSATLTGSLRRIPYYGLNDLGIFLEMIAAEPAAYIQNNLGAFRINRLQTSGDSRSTIFKSTIISWISLALDAHSMGALNAAALAQTLTTIKKSIDNLLPSNPELQPLAQHLRHWQTQPQDISTFAQAFASYWSQQLQHYPDYLNAHSPLLTKSPRVGLQPIGG